LIEKANAVDVKLLFGNKKKFLQSMLKHGAKGIRVATQIVK
jgi:hypothetical protein